MPFLQSFRDKVLAMLKAVIGTSALTSTLRIKKDIRIFEGKSLHGMNASENGELDLCQENFIMPLGRWLKCYLRELFLYFLHTI